MGDGITIGVDISSGEDATAVCLKVNSHLAEVAAIVSALEAQGILVTVMRSDDLELDDQRTEPMIQSFSLEHERLDKFIDPHANRPKFNTHPRRYRK